MLKYLSQENITLALSILGSLGTLIAWYSSWKNSRRNIMMKTNVFTRMGNLLIIHATLVNNSNSPITINSISTRVNNSLFPCYELSRKISEKTVTNGNELKDKREYYSISFPINLSSHYGTSGYFAFEIPIEELKNLSNNLILLFSPSNGKAFEIQLKLEHEENWAKIFFP